MGTEALLSAGFPEGRRSPGERLERFSQRLDLTAGQKEAVRKLLEASRERLMSIRSEMQPKFREKTSAQIRALPTEEQAQEFDRMEAQAREARQLKRPRHPRPSP